MHIDFWTLVLQAINVLILVWILGRFFYRPLSDIIEKRRAAVEKGLAEASGARAAIDADKAAIAAARAGLASERDAILAEAQKTAAQARDTLLRDADSEIARRHEADRTALAQERRAMEQALSRQAGDLAVEIARKLLQRLPPDVAQKAFVDALDAELAALPDRGRQALAADGKLDVTSAAPLDAAAQAAIRNAIATQVGADVSIAFHADAALIAGIELRSATLVLRNSWRDDLATILKQLEADDGQRRVS